MAVLGEEAVWAAPAREAVSAIPTGEEVLAATAALTGVAEAAEDDEAAVMAGLKAAWAYLRITAVVRWFSAIPVKQAAVKLRYGDEAGTAAAGLSYLERDEPNYVVSVAGLPGRMAGFLQRVPEQVKQNTSLRRKGKAPIAPGDLQITMQKQKTDLYFVFPKTDPITLDDKDVEFLMKTRQLEIKRKFKLKKMVFHGDLSL